MFLANFDEKNRKMIVSNPGEQENKEKAALENEESNMKGVESMADSLIE